MDSTLLRAFHQQLQFQSECALIAVRQLEDSLASGNTTATFAALQNFITAATNASRLLWGRPNAPGLPKGRRELREGIDVGADSALKEIRMDPQFELLDERVDRWFAESPSHDVCDLHIGPSAALVEVAEIDQFRSFDPVTWQFTLCGQTFDMRAMVGELERLLPVLKAALTTEPASCESSE